MQNNSSNYQECFHDNDYKIHPFDQEKFVEAVKCGIIIRCQLQAIKETRKNLITMPRVLLLL